MISFQNNSPHPLEFDIGGAHYTCPPKGQVMVQDNHAQFVVKRGLPLTPLSEIPAATPNSRAPSANDVLDAVQAKLDGFKVDVLRVAESAAADVARELRDAVSRFGETAQVVTELGQRFQSFDERLVAVEKGLLEVRSVPAPRGKQPAPPAAPPA